MTSGGIGRPRLCLTFWFAAFGAGDTTQLKVLIMDSVTGTEKGKIEMIKFSSCRISECYHWQKYGCCE